MTYTPQIGIVVPTFNEAGNIRPLVKRIENALTKSFLSYQILFVDDNSTDETENEVNSLIKEGFPVAFFKKPLTIKQGKAYSLELGISQLKNIYITVIDADLQYPPEAIPEMIRLLDEGAGVVVAERKKSHSSFVRRNGSYIFRIIFGTVLHGFSIDIQSGLKSFKREVSDKIQLKAQSAWMFDLEFLLASREAGYQIRTTKIDFAPRKNGVSKIHVLSSALEMAREAIRLKFRGRTKGTVLPTTTAKKIETSTPPIKSRNITEVVQFSQLSKQKNSIKKEEETYIHYSSLELVDMALWRLTHKQQSHLAIFAMILFLLFVLSPVIMAIIVVGCMTFLYALDLLLYCVLMYRSLRHRPEIDVSEKQITAYPGKKWPKYTIFCPLYKEWQVIPQFIRAMEQLDYPKDKLEILLLLEQNDEESIDHVKKMKLPKTFKVHIVPHGKPKTKPKALNYALQHAKGEFAVIYDAEDIPDPHQLKKAVIAFTQSDNSVSCVQAKLNFYNPNQNILTRLFTLEYSLWFDLILPGLQSIDAPIPLGGTSNHFRVSDLRLVGGWDAFNVTEDCDLGMRLAKCKKRTVIVDSTTMEEANSDVVNWFGQRSRWIKGYIQTYLVHTRSISRFSLSKNKHDRLLFHLIVGGKVLSLIVNPFMWLTTVSYFVFRSVLGSAIETFYPAPILYMGVLSLLFGNFIYLYAYMVGAIRRNQYGLVKYSFLVPFYWLSMSVASWRAIYEILSRPHYWRKTVHGLHIQKITKEAKVHSLDSRVDHILGDFQKKPKEKNTDDLPFFVGILEEPVKVFDVKV